MIHALVNFEERKKEQNKFSTEKETSRAHNQN